MAKPIEVKVPTSRTKFVALSRCANPKVIAHGTTAQSTRLKALKKSKGEDGHIIMPVRDADRTYVL